MKKLLAIAFVYLFSASGIIAQSFEFRYHGETLTDGATVTIVAEEDEWGFGEMCCYTNPSSDPSNGLILQVLSGSGSEGSATLVIEENALNPARLLWCMGGSCMNLGSNTNVTKPFSTTNGICQVQFDAEDIQSQGHLLATLSATIGAETHTVKIKFINGEPGGENFDFMVDGLCYNLNAGGTVTVTSGGSYSDAVIIPESVNYNGVNYLVTAIGSQAFYGCSTMTAVIIPNSVTSIGDYAFEYCSNLTWVTIPASVTSMGSNVFYGCTRLQSMLLLGTLCDYFTSGASSVLNLYLAPSVTSVKGLSLSPYQVYCYGEVPAICDASTFNSYSGNLHVPPQFKAPYFADEYWGEFNSFTDDAVWPESVNITLSSDSLTLKLGETAQLTATYEAIPTGMTTLWFSTNSSVVEVNSNGTLTAKALGEARIIAVCGEHFATCFVTVEEETVSIELDHTELTLRMDDIVTITPSHTPAVVPVEYTFTCSDNDVILTQWKNGAIRILATKPGTAVITVGSSDGTALPATCEVTVIRPIGDVNVDGRVTTADITSLYNYLLEGDETFATTSDINGDGFITVADITAIYNILLIGSPTYEYVDLGLPSGTLWATMNIGANRPEEYGYYFAWGETTAKDYYNSSNYKWYKSDDYYSGYTKYCTSSSNGYSGFVDNKTVLDPEDDAAYVIWGPEWRIPSRTQIEELANNCTSEWTTRNGVYGCLFTSSNGASLFLPAAGYWWGNELLGAGSDVRYSSCTLRSTNTIYTLTKGGWSLVINGRFNGYPVRAVRMPQK